MGLGLRKYWTNRSCITAVSSKASSCHSTSESFKDGRRTRGVSSVLYQTCEMSVLCTQAAVSIIEGISRGRFIIVINGILAKMIRMASSGGDCSGLLLCFRSQVYLMRLSHIFWSRTSTARVATEACSFHSSLSLDSHSICQGLSRMIIPSPSVHPMPKKICSSRRPMHTTSDMQSKPTDYQLLDTLIAFKLTSVERARASDVCCLASFLTTAVITIPKKTSKRISETTTHFVPGNKTQTTTTTEITNAIRKLVIFRRGKADHQYID